MNRTIAAALLLACAASALPATAQQAPGPLTLVPHPLTGGVYWVSGGVSNTGFVVGEEGVVLIDAQRSLEGAQKVLAEVARITPKPANTVILTHADPDHVGGLPGYAHGIAIIEHENTRAEIQQSARDPSGGPLTAAYKAIADNEPPTHTIGASEAMTLDGVPFRLIYVAPAHTAGDIMVYLPRQRVVFAGDIILTNAGRFPLLHLGGSSLGWIACMKAILALDADTYVPGHGAIETKAQLRARLAEVEQRRDAIKTMVDQGKMLPEIEAALPDPAVNAMFPTFTQTTYRELTTGYPNASPPWTNIVRKPAA